MNEEFISSGHVSIYEFNDGEIISITSFGEDGEEEAEIVMTRACVKDLIADLHKIIGED